MAKGKYEYWRSTDGLVLLEGWARDGLTDEQIANNIGIRVGTLYDWKNRFEEISNALKKGKAVVDFEVENALLKSAVGFMGPDGKYYPPNATSLIFWLKNRKPAQWRDKVQYSDESSLKKLDKLLEEIDKKAGGV